MSINLTTQNFTSAQVGSKGLISLSVSNRPPSIGEKYPKVVFNNESGCGLALNIVGSNRQLMLPAGAWTKPIDIYNNDSAVEWTVQYVLPNQPVASLFSTLYWPNEKPLEAIALGNSPIGISGNVQTSNVQSITNDGSAPETNIIESTPSDQTQSSITIRNTASGFLQVLSAGILRTVLNVVRGNITSGKAQITIGDSGDLTITTFNGVFGASVTFPAAQITGAVPNATNAVSATTANAVANSGGSVTAPQLETATAGAGISAKDNKVAGYVEIFPTETDATLRGILFDYIDAGQALHGALLLDGINVAVQNGQVFQTGPGFTSIHGNGFGAQVSHHTLAASGTITHGLGYAPYLVHTECNITGSNTAGHDNITTTSYHVTLGNAQSNDTWAG